MVQAGRICGIAGRGGGGAYSGEKVRKTPRTAYEAQPIRLFALTQVTI